MMRLRDWLRPGLHLKRWISTGFVGMLLFGLGASRLLQLLTGTLPGIAYGVLAAVGLLLMGIGLRQGLRSLFEAVDQQSAPLGKGERHRLNKLFYDQRVLSKGPKIVVIGGGTGLSVLLRGLKLETANITAIVTVADDGGGSGKLREDLGMLPPGDIRNCILALAEMEPTMESLLQYRFEDGSLKGQSFGNLLIASMNGISSNFEEAIQRIGEVLAVRGRVLPVSLENITLYARLKNGRIVRGESQIPVKSLEDNSPIEKIFTKPRQPRAVAEALTAIEQADAVVLGPGSLFTSVIPNLLVDGIGASLAKTSAKKIYIPNVMTQPGETGGFTVTDHLEAILAHCPKLTLEYVFVNRERLPEEIYRKYELEGASLIEAKREELEALRARGIQVVEGEFIDIKKEYVRHDAVQLAKLIVGIAAKNR